MRSRDRPLFTSDCRLENGFPVRATTPLHMLTVTAHRCRIRPQWTSILNTFFIVLLGGLLAIQPVNLISAGDGTVDVLPEFLPGQSAGMGSECQIQTNAGIDG